MKLTFLHLGTYGQLGNQMFQIASTIGIATSNKLGYVFPKWKYSKYFIKEIPIAENISTEGEYNDIIFCYHNIPIPKLPEDKCFIISGYFQTELYFKHCSDIIREFFSPKPEYIDMIKNKIDILKSDKMTCSIHVRRGDYVDKQIWHPLTDMRYYIPAMEYMKNIYPDINFLVFSDDLKWCEDNFPKDVLICRYDEIILDMLAMSLCTHNIIANSSFSWWGAWLNKNPDKIVLHPPKRLWFGPAIPPHHSKDIPCESWMSIEPI